MNKEKYVKPQFNIQIFEPNEFCAACGTADLQCNVFITDFTGTHFPHDLYLESNGIPGLQPGTSSTSDKLLLSQTENCGKTYNVKVDDLVQGYATLKGRETFVRWPVWIFADPDSGGKYHAYATFDKPVGANRS